MSDKVAKNDDKIKALMQKVEEQQKALGTKSRARWNTNAVFKYPSGDFINLNTLNGGDLGKLIDAMSFLLSTESVRADAAKRLGIDPVPFAHGGYTITEWEEDFKLRIAIIQYDDRKKELDATKKKLKSLVSEGTRTEMELDEIESLLG
ncbi:MAG: hypothetical protein AB7L09_02515 [Nitrospira sp.]